MTRRPSCVLPSLMARPDAVATALSRRQWGGPFAALADVCGRAALGWSRAGRASAARRGGAPRGKTRNGCPALWGPMRSCPGSPSRRALSRPPSAGAVAGGGRVGEAADTRPWERGDGTCAQAATALAPDSRPRAGCTDGWEAPRQAGRGLFPQLTLVRGLLPALLQLNKPWAGPVRPQGLAQAWQVDQAATTRPCAQRLRRVATWPPAPRRGPGPRWGGRGMEHVMHHPAAAVVGLAAAELILTIQKAFRQEGGGQPETTGPGSLGNTGSQRCPRPSVLARSPDIDRPVAVSVATAVHIDMSVHALDVER